MDKGQLLIKKSLKVVLRIVLSFLLIFLITSVLIQIPVIQNKIVNYATSFISKKTHTRIEIRNIRISFPKLVVVEGLYLEDTQKDTLLYAGKAKINIALFNLFSDKIAISSFVLENANIKLYSTETDSLFNYNFLLTAFSDTTKQVTADQKKASHWTFSIDKVSMKNIRFRYNDEYGGINVATTLMNLEVKMDEIDPLKSMYRINDLMVENLTANVLIKESINNIDHKSESVLPKITARNFLITNSNISYTDSVGKQSVIAVISGLKMEDASFDLQKQLLATDYFHLSKSKIQYYTFEPKRSSVKIATLPIETLENTWKVSMKSIDLEDNSLIYKAGNKPKINHSFDTDYLEFNHLMLEATDLSYSPDETKVSIKKFSAVDQKNFAITSFETYFSMDQHSITAKKLKAKTTSSIIDADLNIQYSSLATLMDSMQFWNLELNLKNVVISNSDILYFNPELIKQPFFKNKLSATTVSGIVNGTMKNLTGKNLVIKTGINTILESDFNIAGLPDIQTASFDFPNLKITSVKKDIEMSIGPYLPKKIEFPENISMQVVFKGALKSFESTVNMNSSFGTAILMASIDPHENFSSKIILTGFNLGSLLNDTAMYGPISLTAEATGQGLDLKKSKAKINAEVSELYLKKYTYHNLKMNGMVSGQVLEGKINLKDKNVEFALDGLVNLNPGQEQYKFWLNLNGADLQKLNFSNADLRIGLVATADFRGGSLNNLNGKAGIGNIVIAHDMEKYFFDSVLVTSFYEPNKSEFNVNSALVDIKYSGTAFFSGLATNLSQFINRYFPLSESVASGKQQQLPDFNFEMQLHNHPILTEVLFPELHEFESGTIQGSFNSKKNDLKLKAEMKKIVYGTNEIKDLSLDVNSDLKALNYKFSCRNISNTLVSLDNFLIDGKLADNKISTSVSSNDEKRHKKLLIGFQIIKNNANYKLTLDPKDFYLMNNQWDITADNYIEFGDQGFLIHHLFLNNAESHINIASMNNQFNDDLNIEIRNFKLENLSGIIEKNTDQIEGTVDGNVMLKRVNNSYGLIADAKISNLFVSNIPIGNLKVKAENPTAEKFNIDVTLSGAENNLTANGYFIPNSDKNSIYLKTTIHSLSLKTVEALSMGTISNASGNLMGNFLVEGNAYSPEITGELVFNNAFITPAFLNNQLELKHETIQLKKEGIYFNSFTILDTEKHTASIDGVIKMNQFRDFNFDLTVNTKDFLLFNTTANDNKEFFGRMIIDSKIEVTGPMKLPVINSILKMKKGSNFTFVVPENKLTTDKGEDVVEFESEAKLNPILYRANKKEKQKTSITGFDISSIIEMDKQATLRLLLDPTSNDSLVVRGEAALSFIIDRSGKMSLTGAYYLNDGSYLVSLESIIKRKFDIDRGSTIIWSGDPYDAEIVINATYSVRASPIDLMADQMSGLSETDKNGYKQRYPFLVLLKLRGKILRPEISFEIQLPPEEKGILSGAVNQKLSMLNEDASALNKQVFALLVLGRFIQENPLQTESSSTSTLVRTTVGKFLSQQLNQWSSKVLPGVDLNFDIQSYNDYQTGQAEGRTQIDIGLKKQLFNERLSIQLGGTVDVEGEMAGQNSASDITSDITVEYKLTKDGRYRLKVFRHNQYEGAIEGQLVETGAGILYVRDFNKWKEFFNSPKNKSGSSAKEKKK